MPSCLCSNVTFSERWSLTSFFGRVNLYLPRHPPPPLAPYSSLFFYLQRVYHHVSYNLIFFCIGLLFVVVQLLSPVQLFATPRTAAGQDSLFFTVSWSLPKIMSMESVMSSDRLILCHPLFLLPSIFPSNTVFSNELTLRTRWQLQHQSF